MNLRDLKYLVALAEHQHFGKAAKKCFVSQPALSMQIKKMESTLGVKLLERTHKSTILTDCGLKIAQHAQSILNQIDEIHEIAKLAKDPFCGTLKIGIFPTLAPYLLPLIMPTLSKTFSKLTFYLVEEQTNRLIEKLLSGELHASFLALPIKEKNFTVNKLFVEEFLLATPSTHIFSKRKLIKQAELKHKDLLLLEEGHCLRDQALTLCQQFKAHENQNFRATSLETLRHMVAAGVGITLIPKLACEASHSISYVPFKHPKPMRTIGLVWRKSSAKETLLLNVSNHIREILSEFKIVKVMTHSKNT